MAGEKLKMNLIILMACCFLRFSLSLPCAFRAYPTGLVCVCNSTYCDNLEFQLPTGNRAALIISTSQNGLRYQQTMTNFKQNLTKINDGMFIFRKSSLSSPDIRKNEILGNSKPCDKKLLNLPVNVHIERNITFQNFIGFGGAFTGSVSYNLNKLKPELQSHIYKSCFSRETGSGFTMIRYTIGGCDSDLKPWAYNELPVNDHDLANFTSLDQRDIEKIRQIKELMEASNNNDIKFIGSAWSPPPWMKTNNDWTGLSSLKDEYYQTWANYHIKFLRFMKNHGLQFWAVTTGNEPLNGVTAFPFIRFMSLGWIPESQAKWVAENLGPSIKDSFDLKDVKILAGDDQRYVFPWWFKSIYHYHPQSLYYIDGHAFHWYWDKLTPSSVLDTSFAQFPNKFIISTEACSGDKPWEVHKPLLGYWPRCEDYILDIIEDFNHHVSGWINWNILLDEIGGPNYVNNFVDAPIIANVTTGEEIYKQPTFYAMGQFSRFILPDSIRINSKSSSNYIRSTAFLRPDGFIIVIIYNKATIAIDVSIVDSVTGTLNLNIPAKSIHSIIFK